MSMPWTDVAAITGVAVAAAGAQWFLIRMAVESAMRKALRDYVTIRDCDLRHGANHA